MAPALRFTFLVHAILTWSLGLLMFFAPATWAAWFNWFPFDSTFIRIFGAALLAIGLTSWVGYRASHWNEVAIILPMEVVFTVLGALAALYELLFAAAPTITWLFVLIFASFAAAWIGFARPR